MKASSILCMTFGMFLLSIPSSRADSPPVPFLKDVTPVESPYFKGTWMRYKEIKSLSESELEAATQGTGIMQLTLYVHYDSELVAEAMKAAFELSTCTVLSMEENQSTDGIHPNRFSIGVLLSGESLKQLRESAPRWLKGVEPKEVSFSSI
jgi:hypothetical protein